MKDTAWRRLDRVITPAISVLVVLMLLFTALVVLWSLRARDIANVTYRNCGQIEALKKIPYDDLEAQIRQSRDFLKKNPHGVDGITPELIKQSIERSIRLRAKYAPSSC